MRHPVALAVGLLASLVAAHHAGAQCVFPNLDGSRGRQLTYTIRADVSPSATVLHVTLAFQGNAAGEDTLYIPLRWAGESFTSLTQLHAMSPGLSLEDAEAPRYRVARYPANQQVIIGYDISKDWTGRFVAPLQFHPVTMPEYVEFTADNALVFPLMSLTDPVTARFDWRQIPGSWILATSFGTSSDAAGRCQAFSGPWMDVQHALFAAGDFRIQHFRIGRRDAVLAIRGEWAFTDDDAIAAIQRTVGVVRDFWKDDDFPYFLVTVKAYDQDSGSSDGSAFTNAFWMYMSRKDPITAQLTTLAHESFHAWNPSKMGTLSGADDRDTQWFKEGFTRYYADVLLYRAGIVPLSKLINDTNDDLRDFPSSTSVYVRGAAIALWLDAELRHHSAGARSLDDVMHDMVRGSAAPITLARILETIGAYLPSESSVALAAAVRDHAALPAPDRMPVAPACAQMSVDTLPTFDLGFDFTASRTSKVVTGVVAGGPAERAGLRNGQPLAGYSFNNGRADRPAKFTITDAGADKAITYLPAGRSISVPQYHAVESPACAAR